MGRGREFSVERGFAYLPVECISKEHLQLFLRGTRLTVHFLGRNHTELRAHSFRHMFESRRDIEAVLLPLSSLAEQPESDTLRHFTLTEEDTRVSFLALGGRVRTGGSTTESAQSESCLADAGGSARTAEVAAPGSARAEKALFTLVRAQRVDEALSHMLGK